MNTGEREHVYYYDYLRVAAMTAVVLLHVSGQKMSWCSPSSGDWLVMAICNGIVRWAVPVFVMISGALFLGREVPVRMIYGKYIFRIVTALAFWSVAYAAVDLIQGQTSKHQALENALKGHFHLWFLYMLIGLYMIVPILRHLVRNEKLLRYLLILSFIFTVLIPQVASLLSHSGHEYIYSLYSGVVGRLSLPLGTGYVFYFLLGYRLSTVTVSARIRHAVYALALLGAAATVLLTVYFSRADGSTDESFISNFTFMAVFEGSALFLLAKERAKAPRTRVGCSILRTLSRCSFGIYLCHAMVIEQFERLLGFSTLSCPTLLALPALFISVYAVSLAVSFILVHIPVVNKYLV